MSVAIVLPKNEFFADGRAGAVALTVIDFLRSSRLATTTRVLGPPVETAFASRARFQAVVPRRAWWRSRSRAYVLGCQAVLDAEPARVVEVHNRPDLFLDLAESLPNSACCLHLHNDPQTMRGCRAPAERTKVLGRAAAVFCVSGFVRARFLDGVRGDAAKVHVLHNAIDVDTMPVAQKRPLILYVGRVIEEKGALPLAQAAAAVLPRLPGWTVVIAGAHRAGATGEPTAYEHAVMRALEPLGERASYRSYLPHSAVMRLFAEAAVAVVPSVWPEPFGRTALEAMAAGCALITSGRGGLGEVVGDAAVIAEPEPEALAEAIARLARDEPLRAALGSAARERARGEFDLATVAARWDAVRQDLMGGMADDRRSDARAG